MRIAILGGGNVGGALGAALGRAGHEVAFGVRNPESVKVRRALRNAPGARAESPGSAVQAADTVIFALRWDAAEETLRQLPSLSGKVVIDAINRFGGVPGRSTAEDLAELLPGARVVKAFNTSGYENLGSADNRSDQAAMFVAGDDVEAKKIAMRLATQIGFKAYDAGGLENAKALEEMVRVWLALTRQHGRRIAFAVSEK